MADMTIDNEIRFFKRDRQLYGTWSNMAQFPISLKPFRSTALDKTTFDTNEHYYQASKAVDYEDYLRIKNAKDGYEAKRLGCKVKLIENWDGLKYHILKHANEVKFRTYPHLAESLIKTEGKRIIEDSDRDYIWGIGADGTGQNLMGKILEEIRSDLIKERSIKKDE